jgi:acetyl esterase/lipase
MKRVTFISVLLFVALSVAAQTRENIWPRNKMPDVQEHQIAAKRSETMKPDFKPEKNRQPYLEWYQAPAESNGGCMILISGGSYKNWCDESLVASWAETFTALGFQCVALVYRTPRPEGLPIYKSAWQDGQRAVRVVRSQANKRGFDPEKIGIIAMSAGSHMGLLLATSSQTPAYEAVDGLDLQSCHINWALLNAPAYGTTDAKCGTKAQRQGYGADVTLDDIFQFDSLTCPISFHHGSKDPYAPQTSTLAYRKLRQMGVPAELHLYPDVGHKACGLERGIEFMRQLGYIGELQPEEKLNDRYTSDDARAYYEKQDIYPEGKTPDFQEQQCIPYIEWHIPKELKTKAIQIIYSGGGYNNNSPRSFEVTPTRRYLNEKGMAVVTLKYRTPRPEGLAKHTTAWQDLQRAIRLVRSQAAEKGLDPDRIGIMGGSAGGHLTLMGVTSSLHQSYLPIDEIDKLPCNVQWGVGIYPAYVLTDGANGHNKHGGNTDSDLLVPEFSFDLATAPMIFIHGDSDPYAAMGSVKVWEKMLSMGIHSELHTLAKRKHCFHREASPGTGSYNFMERIWDFLTAKGFNR